MTYEEPSKLLDESLDAYASRVSETLTNYNNRVKNVAEDLLQNIEDYNSNVKNYNDLSTFYIPDFRDNSIEDIKSKYTSKIFMYNSEKEDIADNKTICLQSIINAKNSEIKDVENKIEQLTSDKKLELQPLEEMQARVNKLKPEIEHIFALYKMQCNAVDIDFSTLGVSDIKEILEIAEYAVQHTVENYTPFSKVVSLLYLPINWKFREEENKLPFYVSYTIALILLFWLARPYFMAVVGIFYIFAIIANVIDVKERKELLQLAYSTTVDINFDNFLKSDQEYINLLQELEIARNKSTADDELKVQQIYEESLEELETRNPEDDMNKEIQEYVSYMGTEEYTEKIEMARNRLVGVFERTKQTYTTANGFYKQYFETLRKSNHFLGDSISPKKVLDLKMRVGKIDFEGEPLVDSTIVLPLKSTIFTYRTEEQKDECVSYMKLLMLNLLCNVKEKYLNITIYDSLELGRCFSEFLSKELEKYIKVLNKDFSKLLDEKIEHIKKNMAVFGTKDIQSYNTESEEKGKVTSDYELLIILSTNEDIKTNAPYRAFLEYCGKAGLIVWQLLKEDITLDDKEQAKFRDFIANLPVVRGYGNFLNENRTQIDCLTYPTVPYRYDLDLFTKVTNEYISTIGKNRNDIIMYEDKYRKNFIPDDKIWTYSTDSGIELCFGFLDGDPTKPIRLMLGDRTPHCLMGGATGSGKSVAINCVLASLLHMYSPEELELVMVDFKVVEFKMYTGACSIPHAKIIAGTTDGEYAISIFEYLVKEMKRRNKVFADNGIKNIFEYNSLCRVKGWKKMPRILVLMDEFQVMFNEVDDRSVDIIKKHITSLSKVARSCGCHLWFTSQSMNGTLTSDIKEQFALRACLKVLSADTSKDLIGNDASSTIKELGYLYTNTSGGSDPKANQFWRIPYCPSDYIKEYMQKLANKCVTEKHTHRRAEFFDEMEVFDNKRLLPYINHPKFKQEKLVMVLGERVAYSENPTPFHFIMKRDDKENIYYTGFEKASFINMVSTFFENLNSKQGIKYKAYCPDSEMNDLLKLDRILDEQQLDYAKTKQELDELLDYLEALIAYRMVNPGEVETPFFYLAIEWEKFTEMSPDNYIVMNRLKAILKEAPNLNIHFIMCFREYSGCRQLKDFCIHQIGTRTTERESTTLMDTDILYKLKLDHIGVYNNSGRKTKFKVYSYIKPEDIGSSEINLNDE